MLNCSKIIVDLDLGGNPTPSFDRASPHFAKATRGRPERKPCRLMGQVGSEVIVRDFTLLIACGILTV